MFTSVDIEHLKALTGIQDPELIEKALTVASNFTGINLEPTARLMLPVYKGLRDRMAVDRPARGGPQAVWKAQLGYAGFDFSAFGTNYGDVGSAIAGSALTFQADYKTQAVKGEVTWEAIPMAQGFDDPLAVETNKALATLISLEEKLILGANQAALTMGSVTGSCDSSGAAFAQGNWKVQVAALTLQGTIANSSGAAPSHVGESLPSAAATITVGSSGASYLKVSWNPVPGAVGYKVYASATAGGTTTYLVPKSAMAYDADTNNSMTDDGTAYIGVTSVRITAAPSNANQTVATQDGTANSYMFEGLTAWAEKSTIYGVDVTQSGSTPKLLYNAAGKQLTLSAGGIVEFDYILQRMWQQWKLSPTLIVTSPQGVAHVTSKLAGMNGGFMYRVDLTGERGGFSGGVMVRDYVNKFAANMLDGQPTVIPIWAHPDMPDGNFLFLVERVPYQYSRESRGFALDVQTPYTYFELARTGRTIPFSLFFTETLKCFHPAAQMALAGVRVE